MQSILSQPQFDYLSPADREFILAFNGHLARLGYDFGGKIGSGYCWGKHMVIYTRAGVKSKNVYARIYLRETGIVLRLFLNKVDSHRAYIENNTPAYIKDVFMGDDGNCQHCHNEKEGACMFRKSYTLEDRLIEKCNGSTFEFHNPHIEQIPDYLALFTEFFPNRKVAPA